MKLPPKQYQIREVKASPAQIKARKELAEIEAERAQCKEKWKDVTDGEIRSLKLYYTALEKEYAPFAAVQPPVNDNTQPTIESVKPKINPAL